MLRAYLLSRLGKELPGNIAHILYDAPCHAVKIGVFLEVGKEACKLRIDPNVILRES